MVFLFVALALIAALIPRMLSPTRPQRTFAARPVVIGIGVVLLAFVVVQIVDAKLLQNAKSSLLWIKLLIGAEGALVATYFFERLPRGERMNMVRFGAFALLTLLACFETMRLVPHPPIDVWEVQMKGAEALVAGANPFEVVAVRDTAPGVVRDNVPYVYPPLQILLTIPSALIGDVRLTMIAGALIAGFALRTIAKTALPNASALVIDAPALMVWLAPKFFLIIEQSWIDPVQLALITVTTALAFRGRMWTAAVLLGLTLASKQTMFWVVLVAIPHFRFDVRQLALAAAVAAATVIPFAAWNFPALRYANFGFVNGLPERPEALSFIQWSRRVLGVVLPHRIGFVLAFVAAAVPYVRRGPIERFGVALLVTYFAFFTFNRWAFANYYFTIGGLAAMAAALSLRPTSSTAPYPHSTDR
jgi:hypothetical protein